MIPFPSLPFLPKYRLGIPGTNLHLLCLVFVWCLPGGIALFSQSAGSARDPIPSEQRISAFDQPAEQNQFHQLKRELEIQLQKGNGKASQTILEKLIKLAPSDLNLKYLLVRVLTSMAEHDQAIEILKSALKMGFRDLDALNKDPMLASLRLHPSFSEIPELISQHSDNLETEPVAPAAIIEGSVTISEKNTHYDFDRGVFSSFFQMPSPTSFESSIDRSGPEKLDAWLKEAIASGNAAGNLGDFYDNRDSGHSRLDVSAFPFLSKIIYGEPALTRGLNQGPQFQFLFNRVTFGNSSTAITGSSFWRSHARRAYSDHNLANFLAFQYRNNQIYVYPEHRDHDPEMGDLFTANTPYLIVSQGSSGSDIPFLKAIGKALASFQPDVKAKLIESGVLMPTLQMLFRYSNQGIQSDANYLTGLAHPTVFDAAQLDVPYLCRAANALTVDFTPPMVNLQVIQEDPLLSGSDYFSPSNERLFDTPQAIARVFRGFPKTRHLTVSAEKSTRLGIPVSDAPIKYTWVVLRGDPALIKISPKNESGSVCELAVSYHEPHLNSDPDTVESNRIDIGVFARDGGQYSAPGIISYYFLSNEKRIYDDSGRIQTVDYRDPLRSGIYIDPAIDARRDWRDEFHYDQSGKLSHWVRFWENGTTSDFTPHGAFVSAKTETGEFAKVRGVRYQVLAPNPSDLFDAPKVEAHITENEVDYSHYLQLLKESRAATE